MNDSYHLKWKGISINGQWKIRSII